MSPSRRRIARDSRRHASGPGQRLTPRGCRDGCGVTRGAPGGGIFANPAVRRAGTCGKWCAVAATTGLHRFIQQGRNQPVARAESHEGSRDMLPLSNYLGSEHPGYIGTEGGSGRARAHGQAGVANLLGSACMGGAARARQYRRAGSETRESKGNCENPGCRRSASMSFAAAFRNDVDRSAGTHFGMPRSVLIPHRKRTSWSGT